MYQTQGSVPWKWQHKGTDTNIDWDTMYSEQITAYFHSCMEYVGKLKTLSAHVHLWMTFMTSMWFPVPAEQWWHLKIVSSFQTTAFTGQDTLPSVLWHCWLSARNSIWLWKMEWWGASVVICQECSANDLHMVQLMLLAPHHLLLC